MGQILSGNFDDGDPVDSAEEAGVIDFRKQALDAKRVASLSWLEFVNYITVLNEKCKQMVDDQGKHLLFAVRKGSTDSYLWKATVQISCIKYNAITKKPESYKCMSLARFLRLYSSMIHLLHESSRLRTENLDGLDYAGSSNEHGDPLRRRFDINASMILNQVGQLNSISCGSLEPSNECVVCMERQPDVVLPCSHAYCLPCIEQWNVNNHDCPTCRADLRSTDEAWVISDIPDKKEFTDYLLQLAE